MADLLSTGIAGLRTYKKALTTVSNNITNVDTDGYHRQRIEIGQNAPSKQAGIYFRNGPEFWVINGCMTGLLNHRCVITPRN
jgi:flagellar hook-associated protein FlgK